MREIDKVRNDLRNLKTHASSTKSILTENLANLVGQIMNPSSVNRILPLPTAQPLSYVKNGWQAIQGLSVKDGKGIIMGSPNCATPVWKSVSQDIDLDKQHLSTVLVHSVQDPEFMHTCLEFDKVTDGKRNRTVIPFGEVVGAFRVAAPAGKSSGLVMNVVADCIVKFELDDTTVITLDAKADVRYWIALNSTVAPAGADVDAELDLGAGRELYGLTVEFNKAKVPYQRIVELSFPHSQVSDPNWDIRFRILAGDRAFSGIENPAISGNPLMNQRLSTAASWLLVNTSPALFSGGVLVEAKFQGLPFPRLGSTDYYTWLTTLSHQTLTTPLRTGGYQYHVPYVDNSSNVITDTIPWLTGVPTYWFYCDYSVVVDGAIPTMLPLTLVVTQIIGMDGIQNILAPQMASSDIGYEKLISTLSADYMPLENPSHLKELTNAAKAVFDEFVKYGSAIINSPVTKFAVEQLITKGVPLIAEMVL